MKKNWLLLSVMALTALPQAMHIWEDNHDISAVLCQ